MNRTKAVTSQDVAQKAGVSQSTVSLVMSGKALGRVSQETQARVRQAARELDYHPNASARSLRIGRTFSIALVVADVANPYFASVLRGAEHAARKHHYTIMLLDMMNDPDWLDWAPDVLADRSLDGCIAYLGDPITEREVARLGPNTVLIEAESPGASSVLLDVRAGAAEAVQHLVAIGHRRIAYLAAAYPKETFRLRFEAYQAILEQNRIRFDSDLVVSARFDVDGAVAAARRLLKQVPRPTAVFCDDDLLAAAVYKAAHALGLRVPDDISITGFDDIELARILEPELTSVAIPAERVGHDAVQLMHRLLKGNPPVRKRVPLTFIQRASTAPPKPVEAV